MSSADMQESKRDRGQNKFDLPPELWNEIYKRLVMSDQIRFASVCKTWLSIASENPLPPPVADSWLMLWGHDEDDDGQITNSMTGFPCLSDKRFYEFDDIIPENQDCEVVGSSNGWVLTQRPHPDPQVEGQKLLTLVNPFLKTSIMVESSPIFKDDSQTAIMKIILVERYDTTDDEVEKENAIMEYVEKSDDDEDAIVSDSSYVTVLVVLTTLGEWFLFSIGSRSGSFVRKKVLKPRLITDSFDDVVFHRGTMCALFTNEAGEFEIEAYSYERKTVYIRPESFIVKGILSNRDTERACLVQYGESVLLVRAQYEVDGEVLKSHVTGFEVFKLQRTDIDVDPNIVKVVKLQSLGGHALFWGRDGCVSRPVGEFSLFKQDHIYFTAAILDDDGTTLPESGVYSLKDGSIKQIPNLPSSVSSLPLESFWFFPNTKYNLVYQVSETKS